MEGREDFTDDELLERAVDALLRAPIPSEPPPHHVAQLAATAQQAADPCSSVTLRERIKTMEPRTRIAAAVLVAFLGLAFADVAQALAGVLLAQVPAAAAPKTFFAWARESLGPFHSLAILSAGVAVFVGACLVVAKSRRPAAITSYLILLPLPFMVGLTRALSGQIGSLAVLSLSPEAVAQLSGSDIAGGVAGGLLPLFVALMVTWPSYLLLAVGLIARTTLSKQGSPE
jgi:hypothetical protein